jgi:hypothetical protein
MDNTVPTRSAALLFAAKASVHQLRRWCADAVNVQLKRWPLAQRGPQWKAWGESVSRLDASEREAQRQLVLGKIENLRIAIRSLNGVEVPAHGVFSFWAQVGRPVARRGFVSGRELREGCIIPTIGGGLCQLSNALYQAALDASLDIVERRAHSQVVEGSAAEAGRDATVFWNYVDLRFRDVRPFRIEASIDGDLLRVAILKEQPRPGARTATAPIALTPVRASVPASCDSCGKLACFRRVELPAARAGRRAVFMVDGVWPEFDAWIDSVLEQQDRLLLPLQGRRQYGWRSARFASVRTFPLLTLWRALAGRMAGADAAVRRASNLRFRQRFARAYGKALHYLDEHVVVTQELLPYLWQAGALQGRSFDVLMTGPPLDELQRRLDAAFRQNPSSPTLADFRAPDGLLALEAQALRCADRIITPHAGLAALFRNATLLPWAPGATADAAQPARGSKILFPASTLGRKGAYELRAAARVLRLRLTLMGAVLEAPGFWGGVETEQRDRSAENWLDGVAVVVLPAWVEGRPVRLLQALAAGVRVIATPACGLPAHQLLTVVDAGDVAALQDALQPFAET